MKITKSVLKEMIREVLREELSTAKKLKESLWTCFFDDREVGTVEAVDEYEAKEKMMDKYSEYPYGLYDGCFWVEPLTEAAMTGGQAEGGFLDTAKRPGGSTKGSGTNFKALEGSKTKKVLARDIKPGMVTDTGKVLNVTDKGNGMEIGYGCIGRRGSYASDNVDYNHEYDVLDESLTESFADTWYSLIAEADRLLDELIVKTGNADYDDGDGYWSGEEGHIWCNRYMYYTDKLNNSVELERLCNEYSNKLPNVTFYYHEDDFLEDAVSEIGYEATNVDYVED